MAEQPQYPWDQQPVEPRRFPVKTAVISVILALALITAVFLVVKPRVAPVTEIVVPKGLAAAAVMSSFVDANFNYAPQANSEYLQGNGVYIYLELINFNQTDDFKVDVTEDIEIKDSSGKTVFERKAFGKNQNQYQNKIDLVRFGNVIPTTGWDTGRYTARIVINDNIAKRSTTNILQFSIKEKSTEVIQRTIDLSSIVSGNTTKLTKQQTVTGPDGKVIDELSFTQEITGDLSTVDLSNILAFVKIPERFDAGTYSVEVKYTNTQNGKSVSVKDTITVVKKLSIDQFVFAKSISDNYVYVVQPNNVYKQGDDVYVYSRLADFAQVSVGNGFKVNFTEELRLIDSRGTTLLSLPNYLVVNQQNDIKRDGYNIKNGLATDALYPGTYTVIVTIKDLNSGQEAVREEAFQIQ